jgi:hypothetical protein
MTTRSSQATQLLDNPLLVELFVDVEQTIYKNWQQEKTDGKRADLWHEFQALGRIKKSLRARAQEEIKENAA